MRFSKLSILLASVLQATQIALAFHIGRPPRSGAALPLPNVLARDPQAVNATSGLVFNSSGGSYYINITLGGQQFSVSIDTGSSDLWVAGTVPNANSTGVSTKIQYALGEDEGPIQTAELNLLGYTVPDQAFIAVTPSDDSPEGFGVIGLGPSSGSLVLVALQNNSATAQIPAYPPIDRIFQNNSVPNFITVLLSRPNDTSEAYPGELTIGEVLPLFQNISTMPNVPIDILQSNISADQHFTVLLDPDGVIGPDGKAITTTSNAPLAPSHNSSQLQVIFDSGFALPQLPKYIVDAFYSGAKGAHVVNITNDSGDVWVLDCDVELNVSFKIAGVTYPIHPLDVTQAATDDNGKTYCFGTFQAILPSADDPARDGILGTTFLSNVYLLVNYGSLIDGSTNASGPYVQVLSTTDPAQAHADFVATRSALNGTTDSPHFQGSGLSNTDVFQAYRNTIFAVIAVVLCIL